MWEVSYSTERPKSIDEDSSKTTVYIRRNINLIPGDTEAPDMYQYEEKQIPKDEWETYRKVMELQVMTDDITLLLAEIIGG